MRDSLLLQRGRAWSGQLWTSDASLAMDGLGLTA